MVRVRWKYEVIGDVGKEWGWSEERKCGFTRRVWYTPRYNGFSTHISTIRHFACEDYFSLSGIFERLIICISQLGTRKQTHAKR